MIFLQQELSKPFKLSSELLSTETDCLLYVVSRTYFKNNLYKQTQDTAIVGSSNVEEQSNVEDEDGANLELRNDADQQANQDDVHSMWPNEEQFIIGSFTDGIFPGEVIGVKLTQFVQL